MRGVDRIVVNSGEAIAIWRKDRMVAGRIGVVLEMAKKVSDRIVIVLLLTA